MKKIIFILSALSVLLTYLPVLSEEQETSDADEEITTPDENTLNIKERKNKKKSKERKKKKSEEEDDSDIIMYLDKK